MAVFEHKLQPFPYQKGQVPIVKRFMLLVIVGLVGLGCENPRWQQYQDDLKVLKKAKEQMALSQRGYIAESPQAKGAAKTVEAYRMKVLGEAVKLVEPLLTPVQDEEGNNIRHPAVRIDAALIYAEAKADDAEIHRRLAEQALESGYWSKAKLLTGATTVIAEMRSRIEAADGLQFGPALQTIDKSLSAAEQERQATEGETANLNTEINKLMTQSQQAIAKRRQLLAEAAQLERDGFTQQPEQQRQTIDLVRDKRRLAEQELGISERAKATILERQDRLRVSRLRYEQTNKLVDEIRQLRGKLVQREQEKTKILEDNNQQLAENLKVFKSSLDDLQQVVTAAEDQIVEADKLIQEAVKVLESALAVDTKVLRSDRKTTQFDFADRLTVIHLSIADKRMQQAQMLTRMAQHAKGFEHLLASTAVPMIGSGMAPEQRNALDSAVENQRTRIATMLSDASTAIGKSISAYDKALANLPDGEPNSPAAVFKKTVQDRRARADQVQSSLVKMQTAAAAPPASE